MVNIQLIRINLIEKHKIEHKLKFKYINNNDTNKYNQKHNAVHKTVINGIFDAWNTYNVNNANLNQMENALNRIHFDNYKFKNFINSYPTNKIISRSKPHKAKYLRL